MLERLKAQINQSKADISRFPADKFLDRDGAELIAAVKVAEAALVLECNIADFGGSEQFTLTEDYKIVMEEYRALKERK